MQMGQQIEYVNCLDLQNTTVSISFMARAVNTNAGSTALTVRSRTIAGVDGACLFAGSNVDSSVTLTTTWTRYTVTRTLPATFGSLSLEFTLGSHVSGDGIMLSQIQLEPGSVATPFERRSYGAELALCQRYYTKSFDGALGTIPGDAGAIYSGTNTSGSSFDFSNPIRFPVAMRIAPTMTTHNPTQAWGNSNWRNSADSADVTTTADSINNVGLRIRTASVPANQWVRGHYTASAEL
jgi:hypothetical protein